VPAAFQKSLCTSDKCFNQEGKRALHSPILKKLADSKGFLIKWLSVLNGAELKNKLMGVMVYFYSAEKINKSVTYPAHYIL
jgi:hypothetical protein